MKSRNLVIAVVAVVVLLGGGLLLANSKKSMSSADMSPSASTADTTAMAANAVTIKGYAFSPAKLTVKKGTTVTWTNQDIAKHTVTADADAPAGGPDTKLFGKGESVTFTFNTVGTFNYHCDPHPYMKASVVVTD